MENSFKVEVAGQTLSASVKVVGLKKFMVHFRRPLGYQGKYGFDWLRDEYIYPIETVTNDNDGTPIGVPKELCKNVAGLKTEYKTTGVKNAISPYGKDYYPAWLSIFPSTNKAQFAHGSSMHKSGVDLDLEIEELEPLISDDTELIFESNNQFLTITPEKLNLKDLIGSKKTKSLGGATTRDYYQAKKKVNIKCKGGTLSSHEEIKVFAELSGQKKEVGKLMVYKNSVIPKAEIVVVNVPLGKTSSLRDDYQFIFKNQSFNQSLIRADVDVETYFDVSKLPRTDTDVDDFVNNYSSGTIPSGKSASDFTKELISLYDTYGKHKPQSGQIDTNSNTRTYLFFTNLQAGRTNGICSAEYNTDASGDIIGWDWGNAYVVFTNGLANKRTFIHECCHSYSLPHIFMEPYGILKVSSSHVFYQGYTDNYMDYTWQKGSRSPSGGYYSSGDNVHKGKMYSLFKWQWSIMRKDESLLHSY